MSYVDPVKVAPRNYKELFKRGQVRLLDMRLKPGESDAEHSHPFNLVYFVKGGRMRIHTADSSTVVTIADDHLMEHDGALEKVENIGGSEIHALVIEFWDEGPTLV